jgi:hypothetical protein
MTTFLGKVTSQLNPDEFEQVSRLFSAVFSKQVSTGTLRAKYRSPVNGISYHAMMTDDAGIIAGFLAIIPFEYSFFGKKVVFGNLVDLMIRSDCRKDITLMKKLYDTAIDLMGIKVDFLYAIPNPNPYLYFKKILGWSEIGTLHYFILPLHVSKLSPRLKGLDFLSESAAAVLNRFKWPVKSVCSEKPISRERTPALSPAFISYRFPQHYKKLEKAGGCAYYIVVDEESAGTAYIIDIWPLTSAWLQEVVRTVWRNEGHGIDCVLYVGTDIPRVPNFFKVPLRYEPRALHFIGKIVSGGVVDERINNIKNWHFNLSDFDVR